VFGYHGYKFDAELLLEHAFTPPIYLAGVDEAGRGPLAGPVVTAAVILRSDTRIYGLRDSKLIPLEQREALYCEIMEEALAVEIAIMDVDEIDRVNILQATLAGMRSCLQALPIKPHIVFVDGHMLPKSGFLERKLIGGDNRSASIMAASIVAKVTRDHLMMEAHALYPHYGFHEHKGYSVPQHLEALRTHGPCPLHRRSFDPVRQAMEGKWSQLITEN
jgi:ribonuclease HII